MRQPIIFISVFVSIVLLLSNDVFALSRGGGGGGGNHSFGGGFLYLSPSQDDLNSFITNQATTGTNALGTGYELFFQYTYRFASSMWALNFRPGYFTQKASGGGVEASLTGITFFPALRIYALESDFIHFFFQVGVGYGNVAVKLTDKNGGGGSYDGSTFGGMGGIGVAFCFTSSHCMTVEGNARYLPIQPVTGSGNTLAVGVSQPNGELEMNGNDARVSLGGFQAALGYEFHF